MEEGGGGENTEATPLFICISSNKYVYVFLVKCS
jgi:hypothetical protein